MPRLPIQARFAAIVLLAYAAVGAVSLATFVGLARRWISAYAVRYAGHEALLQRSRVSALIEPEVAMARKLADDPTVLRWVAERPGEEPGGEVRAALDAYGRAFRDHGWFVAVDRSLDYFVYDPASKELRRTKLRQGVPANQWYFDERTTSAPYLLNLDYEPAIRASKLWINVPLRDAGGRVLGMTGGAIDITDLLAEIASGDSLDVHDDAGAERMLVDRAGVLQVCSNRAYMEHNAHAAPGAKLTLHTLLEDRAQGDRILAAMRLLEARGSEVETLELGHDGRRLLAAVSFMPELGWFNVVLLDTSEIATVRTFLPLLVAVAVAVALMLVALLAVLDRSLLRRLGALTAAARAVSTGDYGARVDEGGRDEVALLGRTFNAMTARIGEETRTLEERVEERTRRLSEANARLETSQQRIEESLRYAREIQAAVLPPAPELEAALGSALVLYRPCELVGGDFYWLRRLRSAEGFLVAVVDCTGHGVPGAFMSMMASSALSHAAERGGVAPGSVLSRLDALLLERLHAPGAEQGLDAGLDIGLASFRPGGPLLFAGAGLSLWLVEGARVREVRGERQRVGYRREGTAHAYLTQAPEPAPGARVYLATDGVLDQPGGPRGFGFGRERLAALLGSLAAVPLPEQAARIEAALREWAGPHPQRDDVTVVGFEVTRPVEQP